MLSDKARWLIKKVYLNIKEKEEDLRKLDSFSEKQKLVFNDLLELKKILHFSKEEEDIADYSIICDESNNPPFSDIPIQIDVNIKEVPIGFEYINFCFERGSL